MTKVEIELLTDIDQILFVEDNIRGGVSFINDRYIVEEKDVTEKTSLLYIDGKIYLIFRCAIKYNIFYSFQQTTYMGWPKATQCH